MKDGVAPSDAELTLANIPEEEAEQRLFLCGVQVQVQTVVPDDHICDQLVNSLLGGERGVLLTLKRNAISAFWS